MKVSVVVPVYNTEAYLAECLQSLVDQTLPEMEIVVVNDGSTDGSQAIIENFAYRYPTQIRMFTKANGGLSEARNFGLDMCCGEYVGFVDSDDFVTHSMFAELHAEAVSMDADIAICPITYAYEHRRRCWYFPKDIGAGKSVAESPGILLMARSYAWNKIYRRSMLLARSFRFPVGQHFEDSAVVYNIMLDANRIAAVNIPFYQYRRQRQGAITSALDSRIFDVFLSCESILLHYRAHPQYQSLQPYVASLCVRHVFARIRALWHSTDRTLALSFATEASAFLDRELDGWKSTEYFARRRGSRIDTFLHNLIMKGVGVKLFLATPFSLRKMARREFQRARKIADGFARSMRKRPRASVSPPVSLDPKALGKVAAIGQSLGARGIANFLDFGTLLGIVREGRLIAHDKDINIGVLGENSNDAVRQVMVSHGLRIWRQYLLQGRVVGESYIGGTIKIDVAYYKQRTDSSSTWLFYRKPGLRYSNNQRNVVEMRYGPIGPVVVRDVAGVSLNVPATAETLLMEKYGPGWRNPDPSWIYWQSPAAIIVDGMGHYIQFEHLTSEAWKPHARKA